MQYLLALWLLFGIAILLYIISYLFNKKKIRSFINDKGDFFVIVIAIPLLIMAILTNDPVTVAGMQIPMEFEWFGSIIFAVFVLWLYYLAPLKSKVYRLDREIGGMKGIISGTKGIIDGLKENASMVNGNISSINGQISDINGQISGMKGQMAGIKSETKAIRSDLHLIKEKLFHS
ncbi:MAG: hypothetical protein KJ709_05110 [Nanoarchaeota archaeon]|nr:hypothetical protein [Nanoarchaeota archaeon]